MGSDFSQLQTAKSEKIVRKKKPAPKAAPKYGWLNGRIVRNPPKKQSKARKSTTLR